MLAALITFLTQHEQELSQHSLAPRPSVLVMGLHSIIRKHKGGYFKSHVALEEDLFTNNYEPESHTKYFMFLSRSTRPICGFHCLEYPKR